MTINNGFVVYFPKEWDCGDPPPPDIPDDPGALFVSLYNGDDILLVHETSLGEIVRSLIAGVKGSGGGKFTKIILKAPKKLKNPCVMQQTY